MNAGTEKNIVGNKKMNKCIWRWENGCYLTGCYHESTGHDEYGLCPYCGKPVEIKEKK